MAGWVGNIEEKTLANDYFREVLFTAPHSQLVVMSLKPGEDIGTETHADVDQFLRIESGEGKTVLNGQEQAIRDGSAIVVPAGTEHNIINTSSTRPMKIYTIYSPPEHRHGVIHKTKAEAQADTTDHP
ncbi:MAG: cupin domain-containing protein [Chloroflexi bacterium]|nr:cupin domain-containing protein [Chloroflexota bacterium]